MKAEIEARDCKRAKVAEFDDYESQQKLVDMQEAFDTLEANYQQLKSDVATQEHRAKWYEKMSQSMMNCTKDCRGCAEKIKAICDNAQ